MIYHASTALSMKAAYVTLHRVFQNRNFFSYQSAKLTNCPPVPPKHLVLIWKDSLVGGEQLVNLALWSSKKLHFWNALTLHVHGLGTVCKVQCLKKGETNDSEGRGGQDPSSYFNQCLIDIDFVYSAVYQNHILDFNQYIKHAKASILALTSTFTRLCDGL